MPGLGVEVAVKGGLHVAVGFGVSALGAVAGRVRDLDEAPAVGHKARPPAVGGEPPRPVDLAEEGGCDHALLLVRVEAVVLGGELLTFLSNGQREKQNLRLLRVSQEAPHPPARK